MRAIILTLGIACLLGASLVPEQAGAAAPRKAPRSAGRSSTTVKPAPPVKPKPAAAKPEPTTGGTPHSVQGRHLVGAPSRAGTLRLPYDEFAVSLLSWLDPKMITVTGKNGIARVAPGSYWLTSWSVRLKDDGGRVWRAEGGPHGQPQAAFRVSAGGTTTFGLATPLRAALTVDQVDSEFAFVLRFEGTAGDRCSRVMVDDAPAPAPKLKITDADGALVETLELKWGCGFLCRKTWAAPADVKWPLKAIVEADCGPFPVIAEPAELRREKEPAPAAPAETAPPAP